MLLINAKGLDFPFNKYLNINAKEDLTSHINNKYGVASQGRFIFPLLNVVSPAKEDYSSQTLIWNF